MNNLVFRTDSSWDNTTLFNNGIEVMAAQLFVELRAGRDEFDNPTSGGIFEGADLSAIVRPQDDPYSPWDILPGRLELNCPGYVVVIENFHPGVYLDQTRVLMNGEDITARVVDFYCDINGVDGIMSVWITVYKPHWIRRDELITHTIIG